MFREMDIISAYTRADAIDDGMLIEVDQTFSKRVGFTFPIALTSAVWNLYVSWSKEDNKLQTNQIQQVRLGHLLARLRLAIVSEKEGSDTINFVINVVPKDGEACSVEKITLKSVCHGGDDHEPVITIMLPTED